MLKVVVLIALALISEVKLQSLYDEHKRHFYIVNQRFPRITESYSEEQPNEEYIRQVQSSSSDTYEDEIGGRVMVETNALIDTKYRAWKRNADQINFILGLPKGMSEAGR